jgi:hypothetical protein
MRTLYTSTLLAAALAACGGSNNNNNTPDAPNAADGPPAQMGTSFDNAIDITSAIDVGTGTMGTLPDTKTKVYYKLTLAASDRMIVTTATNAINTTDGSVTDTVVTLYTPDKQPFAQDDDGWPRSSTDSQLFTQVGAAGVYFITVEDCNSHSQSGCYPSTGVKDFAYTLHVLHTSKVTTPEVTASGTNDGQIANADGITYKVPAGGTAGQYGLYTLDGGFAAAGGTHVYGFKPPTATLDAGGREHAEFFVQPIGAANGNGSTSNIKAWVTAANGTTVLGSADEANHKDGDNATNGPLDLSVPVTPGTQYYLFVKSDAATSTPATDFYFAVHFAGQFFYGTAEKEGPTGLAMNDTSLTAEKLTTPSSATAGSFFADGNIASAADVDWYEVDPPTGDTKVTLDCAGARAGSGVTGLKATLYAADGTTMIAQLAPETANADSTSMGTVPAATAKAFVKVQASGQDTTNTGTYYRCDVFYAP